MLKSALLAAAAATAIAGRTIDLAQYHPLASAESAARAAATRAAKLAAAPSASLSSPARLYAWLAAIDRAERDLQRADVYVYLRSEENVDDTSDALADERISATIDRRSGRRCDPRARCDGALVSTSAPLFDGYRRERKCLCGDADRDRGSPQRRIEGAGVTQTLALLRASQTNRNYEEMTASVRGSYMPPPISVDQAIMQILAASQPMGAVDAGPYERLFDPARGRVEVCVDPRCDRTGFSVGYAGVTSGVFLGKFDGSTNSARALAHEAGHAVHRQFMNQGQPIGFYNSGPSFMFESFAIFNELLFLDHLYASAAAKDARAYYLRQFTDDAVFQIYGSAKETDLEASIYRGVGSGTIRDAADLEGLTMRVFAQYDAKVALDSAQHLYWARDSLFYTDPLYDVNYLFAGMLALTYFDHYERNPKEFSRHYVALLRSGFNADPKVLEKTFLDIDLADVPSLVRTANDLIDRSESASSRNARACDNRRLRTYSPIDIPQTVLKLAATYAGSRP